MSVDSVASASGDGRAIAGAMVTALLALGLVQGTSARAADDPPTGEQPPARPAFLAEVRRTLKADDLRLVTLANQVLGDPAAAGDPVVRARIEVIKAEGEAQYATMRREIAELALKEYTEAVLPQEVAARDGEVSVANASLVRARALAQQANGDVEKLTSQLELEKANLEVQGAESRKKVLAQFTRPSRTKELAANVAKARTEEHLKNAELGLRRGRLEGLEKTAPGGPRRADVEKRILALIERALPLEERIQAGLQRLAKEAHPAESAEREIRGLAEELGAIIDAAEAIKAADDFNRVKERLKKAARP